IAGRYAPPARGAHVYFSPRSIPPSRKGGARGACEAAGDLPGPRGVTMQDVVFEAPDAGSWELESTHFQRPVSRFTSAAFGTGLPRGFTEGSARYGLLMDHLEPAVVNGFMYMKPVMFGEDRPGGTATPDEMQARIMVSAEAFGQKRWRADLALWDEVD